jgi:alanine-glyoxylate transaminase/serine-glyoxylate transaminase/serine-pyruvate transaminase
LDVLITGSQKGLGVPPGLSIVVASQKALQVVQDRKTPVPSYYSNWNKWLPGMIQIIDLHDKQITNHHAIF